jgi:hypothetical protein
MKEIAADVALPCEEKEFASGVSRTFIDLRICKADNSRTYHHHILSKTSMMNLSMAEILVTPHSRTG